MSIQLPSDIENEVNKLAAEYPYKIEFVRWIYMMGGYEHGKELLNYKLRYGFDDDQIKLINQSIWDKKNKESLKELESLNK
jgi:hypothetical protein